MVESNRILFILAHYDDESFSAGTIKRLIERGKHVSVLIVCGLGATLDDDRRDTFESNMKKLGAEGMYFKYLDLTLRDLKEDVKAELKNGLYKVIMEGSYDTIFTNHSGDIHHDHQEVSNMVRTVCRPQSIDIIKKLYEVYVPGSAEYGTGINDFKTIVNVSGVDKIRSECILRYGNHLKGASSFYTARASSEYFGQLYGMKQAEIFKLVWDRSL